MARPKRLYVPLDVEFATDPKIITAGHTAAYLYICSLAHAKRAQNDGRIARQQLPYLAPGLPGKPEKHAATLVAVGLWEQHPDGYAIAAWLKHNLSAGDLQAQEDERSARGVLANHLRHHADKGIVMASCPHCSPSQTGPLTVPNGTIPAPARDDKRSQEKRREVEGREVEGSREKRREEKSSVGPRQSSSSLLPDSPADDDEEHAAERTATVEEIIDAIIGNRSVGVRRTNPAGYLRTARANFATQERPALEAMLAEFPHWARGPQGAEFAASCYIGRAQAGAA